MHDDSVTWETDAITPATALLFPGSNGFCWFPMVSLGVSRQDPLMFSGTLRFNLDFQGHHTDEEIWAALRLARLEKQVMEMPLKLDEPVQEQLNLCWSPKLTSFGKFSLGVIYRIAGVLRVISRLDFIMICCFYLNWRTISGFTSGTRRFGIIGCQRNIHHRRGICWSCLDVQLGHLTLQGSNVGTPQ